MSETRTFASSIRRIVIPLIIAIVLVVGTVIFSGSSLIRIEDVTVNRILAGTYGTPDWRVQEMNPLLAQLLTLLYRIAPAINWYGALLLALMALAAAMGMGLAARKAGGLMPAIILVSPIVVLMTNAVVSTAVCAICAAVGAFSAMEGIQRRKEGAGRATMGFVLFLFAAMLSLRWAIVLGVCTALCYLPCSVRDSRLRGLLIGVPLLAVVVAALFGYQSLMYNTPELTAYRDHYALYEKLQHSSLKEESEALVAEFGQQVASADHSTITDFHFEGDGHDHGEDEVLSDAPEDGAIVWPNSFDSVGWTINDASLFFTRFGSDTQLTDPEVLRTLEGEAEFWNFTPAHLFGELFATVKKPQFLLLIAMFVVGSLALLITSRRRGLVVVLAALIAFGGHVLAIARYYNTFADIAPFYLLAIAVLLYFFDGADAKAWYHRVLSAPWLRMGLSSLALVVFVAALGGLLYYTRITPANSNSYTVEAAGFLKPAIAEHKDILFIGDNPNDRVKPSTLTAPIRGEDENLLAGSYDLYSPRAAAMMERFGITNPLADCIGNDKLAFVSMSFAEPVNYRLSTAYGVYAQVSNTLAMEESYSEMIIQLEAITQEDLDLMMEQYNSLMDALSQAAENAEAEEGESPQASQVPEATAAPVSTVAPKTETHKDSLAEPPAEILATPVPMTTPGSNG